ncbi:MAG: serine/threonine protein kinase [Deltaproteobacteria bacterium]|nr:serine/threonine protein kinase [Deltaproteobacteria bacterium]MCB9785422.1 serine/threonine protein kinase [Deltaproteobacteria bacterium]
MSQDPPILGRIGRYELLERVGAGGMGEVFLARTTGPGGFEKQVVIKKILPHLADNHSFVRRFTDEGRLVVQLRHAGIAQILDMGEEGGVTFLAMEHVDGRDLRDLLRLAWALDVRPSTEVTVGVLVRVLEALDYAHAKKGDDGRALGIIHRDVTPSNVMVSRSGEVKLVDFGIARATDRLGTSVSGALQGKFGYMSPQQAAGAPLDARSDQFAVGVVAWEMLVGRRPFDGASDLETLDRIRHAPAPPLAEARPDLPAEITGAVDRMLAKEPEQRFPTAGDAARALHAHLFRVGELVGAREIGDWVADVLDAAPEGLRAPSSAGLSLDDALRLSLESGKPARAPATVSVAPAPLAERPSAASGALAAFEGAPGASTLATPARTPTSTPLSAGGAESGTIPPLPPPGRKLLGAFGLLIALNVLLLGSVAFLLWLSFAPGDSSERKIIAAEASPEPALAASPPAARLSPPVAEAAPLAPPEAEAAPAEAAPETPAAPVDAGRQVGLVLASLPLPAPAPPSQPAEHLAPAGERTAPPRPPREPVGTGTVSFRYYPASATVLIDGKQLPKSSTNLVRELPLPAGPHTLTLVTGPGPGRTIPFTVVAGDAVNLKQVSAVENEHPDPVPPDPE